MREHADFSLKALYEAIDTKRRSREMSWAAVMREINRFRMDGHPIASSTIRSLETKAAAEGDGVLQMLLWLGRTPESFVPGFPDADAERFRVKDLGTSRILRWDTRSLYSALNSEREARDMTWAQVAQEIGGHTPAMLTNLRNGGRAGFPGVMRIVAWLGKPAASFTRASYW
jgi:hypothetical protein